MERISAAGNLRIEMDESRWRLIVNGDKSEQTVIEAQTGEPLRYIARYAEARRLPDESLPVEQIRRIVLGWSNQDESWHLGLLLNSPLADRRGSRWCEVARWPDPDIVVFEEIAQRAGEALAQVIERPFYVVPPERKAAPPPPPPKPLPALPLDLGGWFFEQDNDGYQFRRSPAWARSVVRRILWYSFWVGVYIVLVVATFTSGIAPAQPEFLPYLGIFSAVVLVMLNIRGIFLLLTRPNRIRVDPVASTIGGYRGNRMRWQRGRGEINAVYVSHVVGRRGRRGTVPLQHSELNLQLSNGDFQYILSVDPIEEHIEEPADLPASDVVRPLTSNEVLTGLQAAAVYTAQALRVPSQYDRRVQ